MALTVKGLDYAWGRPDYAALQRAGYKFAMRYLSHDKGKDLNAADLKQLLTHGLDVGVVWETTADRAAQGRNAGASDAHEAKGRAAALGLHDIPIYFAVDFDAAGPEVEAYFRGVQGILGKARTGVYGGYRVIAHLSGVHLCTYYWQTLAWSAGKIHPRTHIYQSGVGRNIAGVSADPDLGRSDFNIGTRGPNQQHPHKYGSRVLHRGAKGTDVRELQKSLNARLAARKRKPIKVDGVYGGATEGARHYVEYVLGFPLGVVKHAWTIYPTAQKIIRDPSRRDPLFLARATYRKRKK